MGIIARQSIKGTLATYLGVAIGFFTTFFVITRYLTTEEVGLTRVLVDATMLFAALAQLGCNSTLMRFFPWFRSRSEGHHGVFGLSLLVPLAGMALFALLFLVFKGTLMEVYGQRSPLLTDYFYVLPMMTFFVLYMTVFENNATLLMRISVPRTVREVGVRLFNLAAYILYGYKLISLDLFVWLFCGSYALAMVLDMVYVVAIGVKSVDGGVRSLLRVDWEFLRQHGMWREMVSYAAFMIANLLAGNVALLSTLFLGAKAGLAATGVYTIALYIANVVEIPNRSLGVISQPVISAAVKEDDWREANRMAGQVSLHQLMTSSLMLYLIWINLDTLFAVIPNGADYAGGVSVVLVLGLGKIVLSTANVGNNVLSYSRYYKWTLAFSLLLTVLSLLLNNVLIDVWDIDGAAAAIMLAYLIHYTLQIAFLRWKLKVWFFTRGHLKMVAVMAALAGLDLLWRALVAPLFGSAVVADSLVKTAVLGTLAAVAVYAWRISPSVNGMVEALPGRLKRKGGER